MVHLPRGKPQRMRLFSLRNCYAWLYPLWRKKDGTYHYIRKEMYLYVADVLDRNY